MLSRYNNVMAALLPRSEGRYLVSTDGTVFDMIVGEKLEAVMIDSVEHYTVKTPDTGYLTLNRSVMVALAFKGSLLHCKYWHLLDVQCVDGDEIHPSNLIWRYPGSGICIEGKEDFRSIPGFSRYAIDQEGTVINVGTGMKLAPYKDEMGYSIYGVTPDVGKRTIVGMHRLLALAFLPYPSNVDSLDVNHIDGNKGNNCLRNLEWASRKRNCDHAYSTGLRNDNIPIEIRNCFTGETFEFYSAADCSEKTGLTAATSRLRAKTQGQKLFPLGIQFREKKEGASWKEYDNLVEAIESDTRTCFVKLTNVETGKEFLFPSRNSAGEFLGISSSSVRYHLSKNDPNLVVHGHLLVKADIETLAKSYFDGIRNRNSLNCWKPLIAYSPLQKTKV